jgi:hypothetical protein
MDNGQSKPRQKRGLDFYQKPASSELDGAMARYQLERFHESVALLGSERERAIASFLTLGTVAASSETTWN